VADRTDATPRLRRVRKKTTASSPAAAAILGGMALTATDETAVTPPPLRRDGLFRRSAPFVASAVLGVAAATAGDLSGFGTLHLALVSAALATVATYPFLPWERLPSWTHALPVAVAFVGLLAPRTLGTVEDVLQLAGALSLTGVALALYLLPWDRLPRWLHALPPLGALVALLLLGEALGTSASLIFPIAVLAILWLTLHHTRRELLVGVVLAAVLFLAPQPLHAYSDLGPRLLYTAIVAVVAVSVQTVVRRTRYQAVELAAAARELQLMQEVAATLSATLDVDAILAQAVRSATEMIAPPGASGRRATILRLDGDRMVSVAEHASDGTQRFTGTVYRLAAHPVLRAAVEQRRCQRGAMDAVEMSDDTAAAVQRAELRSYLLEPIVIDGQVWGLLTVGATDDGGFDDRQRQRLSGIVNVTQLALANALSYARQHRTARRLASLVSANLSLAREVEPESVLQKLADTAREVGSAEYAAIAVIAQDGRRVESFTESGSASDAAIEEFRPFDMDRGVAGGVLRDRRVIRLTAMGGEDHDEDESRRTALLGLPLLLHDQLLGAIYLIGKIGQSEFTAEDEVVAGGLAAQAAVAITNVRLVQRLAEHAATDPLTGLRNRREFERVLSTLPRQPFAVLAIDIDNLKALNDEFGHEAGDLVLQISAATLSAVLRGGDVLARVGGDEFAALLLDVDADVAADVADRMRSALHGTALPHGRARISIGCAPAPRGADPHGVWRAADDALYQAKRGGRDRVVVIEHGSRVRSVRSQSSWAETLVDALDERIIESVYQPIVALDTRDTVAYEALARPAGMTPSASVDGLFHAAQRLGRMRDLDWLCRRAAIEGMRALHEPCALFINISTVTLLDPLHDVDQMLLLCDWAGHHPSRLVLEITERETVRDMDRLRWVAAAYREHGIRFAIDDVGEGHSTLEVMAAVSPEFIKVASSLTTTIERSGSRAAVRAAVAFASSTGAAVIAEGVENEHTAEMMASLGVKLAQGFWLGRPMRGASLPEMHGGRRREPV